jgi:hypothetical protein
MSAPFTVVDESTGTVNYTIDASGNSVQNGNETCLGNSTVVKNFTVTGTSTFTGATTLSGAQTIAGLLTLNGGTDTAGSAPVLTPTLSSGTAAQLADLTRDYSVTMNITTSGTATHIEIGPTSTPANTVLASASVTAGQVVSFRLPAGWFIKWTGTTTALSTLAIGC